eukprot:CAMPEP_0119090286 /NCGR_PEP_ID=MMETSP1178-20130426/152077_1 /TAXON_ID=33656 /ORGANISM="unid sp, Strain CCMP2000" /LENGTH=173 /DNA_ID=CAMNT_0007073693 /DNA_START=58 /DNA_END=579 /DNA_ORIENTATION=+
MRLPTIGQATVTALLASATDAMWQAQCALAGASELQLNADVEVRSSFGKGLGVFALRDIPVETVVARYTGRLYSMPEFEEAVDKGATTGDYAFQVIPGWVIDGEDPERSSWSRYVNHSLRRQNCHAFPGPGFIYLEAIQDIPAGSELFFNYGDDYWIDRAPPTSLRRVAIDLL